MVLLLYTWYDTCPQHHYLTLFHALRVHPPRPPPPLGHRMLAGWACLKTIAAWFYLVEPQQNQGVDFTHRTDRDLLTGNPNNLDDLL